MMKQEKFTEVNDELLMKELPVSLRMAEKLGKHSDKLGLMLLALAEIVLKKLKPNFPDYVLDDIRQEIVISCLKMINKLSDKMDSPFNYLYIVAQRRAYELICEERNDASFRLRIEELVKQEQEYINQKIVTDGN